MRVKSARESREETEDKSFKWDIDIRKDRKALKPFFAFANAEPHIILTVYDEYIEDLGNEIKKIQKEFDNL